MARSLAFLAAIALVLVASHAASEDYFNKVLPNTRMPRAVRDSLRATAAETADPNTDMYFEDKELTPGKQMTLHFKRATGEGVSTFQSENECDSPFNEAGDSVCAKSLESMVDYVSSKLGKNVKGVSTEMTAQKSSNSVKQMYKVTSVKKSPEISQAVACHKQNYAYAVFYCHESKNPVMYQVEMVGENGDKVKATGICHMDSIKGKKGPARMCHFLPQDDVFWVSY